MKKFKITTSSLKDIRPVFTSVGDNIHRYKQLKSWFDEVGAFELFAEPTQSSSKQIDWYTGLEHIEIRPYSELSATEQERAKGILKHQVNSLFKIALLSEDKQDKLFETIESCIEIPNLNCIYELRLTNHKPFYTLVQWGFVEDRFDAPRKILKNLIPFKVSDILFQVYDHEGKKAVGQEVYFEFGQRKLKQLVAEDGTIRLYDIPFFERIQAYQLSFRGQVINSHQFENRGKSVFTIHLNTPIQTDFILQVQQHNGQPAVGETIVFKYNRQHITVQTDENGEARLPNINLGSRVDYAHLLDNQLQNEQGKKHNGQAVLLRLAKPKVALDLPKEEEPNKNIATSLTVLLQDANDKGIAGKEIVIVTPKGNFTEVTNEKGEAVFEDLQAGDQLDVIAKLKKQEQRQIQLKEGANQLSIQIEGKKRAWIWWWLGGLLLLILLLILLLRSCDGQAVVPPVEDRTDNIQTLNEVKVKVVDKYSQMAIKEAKVNGKTAANYNKDKLTDEQGEVRFQQVTLKSSSDKLILYTSAEGYGDERYEMPIGEQEVIIEMSPIMNGGRAGKRGELSVSLEWATTDDLDLMIIGPCGDSTFFQRKETKCQGIKGMLDVDANATDSRVKLRPQENIYWAEAPKGDYEVKVVLYKHRNRSNPQPIPFEIIIQNRNNEERVQMEINGTGAANPKNSIVVKKLSFQ
ncbi:MAG: Ig-like domain-containing protein [Saprospiraceae bacterium]|nr:Ig-like domain-containing protein [Saprospiraceae bacterium]